MATILGKAQFQVSRASTEFASLDAAIAALGASSAVLTLVPGDTKTLTGDLTIPANITLSGQGGVIAVPTGVTLTIEGPIVAGPYPLFDVSGGGTTLVSATQDIDARWWGAAGDGATDDYYPLVRAIQSAEAGGGAVRLAPLRYRFALSALPITSAVRIKGEGATLLKDHGSNGLRIVPEVAYTGAADAASQGASTITVQNSPGFTVDEYAGHFVSLAVTDFGGGTLRRRIVSNTADTITLDYPVGVDVPAASEVNIYERIELVRIEDLTVEGDGGSAGISIMFVDNVEMRNVRSVGHAGNAITLDTCARVRMENCSGEDSQFAIFVHNSDDVILTNCVGKNGNSTHHIQLKDCRNSKVVCPTVIGGANNPAGSRGVDVKCSGRNPSFNVHIVDANVIGVTGAGVEAYGSQDEGDYYNLENATIGGRVRAGINVPSVGFRLLNESPARIKNVRAQNIQSYGCAGGLGIFADDVEVSNFTFEGSTGRSVGGNAARVKLANGVIRNGNTGGADVVMRLTDCTDWDVSDVLVVHTDSGSFSTGVAQELGSSDRNVFRDVRVIDTEGTFTTGFYIFVGSESRVSSTTRTRQSVAYGTPLVLNPALGEIIEVGVLTGNVHVSPPRNGDNGRRMTLRFTQDGTGGRSVSWDPVFKVNWTPDTSANAMNIITFEYDGTNWVQQSAAVGL